MSCSPALPAAEQPGRWSAQPEREFEFTEAPFAKSVWAALEALYASVYSSRALLEPLCGQNRSNDRASAWIERSADRETALLLFTRDGSVVRVLNEVLDLPTAVIRRFAQAIFARYPQVDLVKLHAIVLQAGDDGTPLLSSVFSEDYVLDLPDHHEAWLASLSRQTREKLRYHQRRSFRRQPGLEFTVTPAAKIAETEVRAVLRLNRQRMQRKGKAFAMSDSEEVQLCMQMQQVGMLFALRLDGEICAGLLCSVTGRDICMHVIAHDPAHDDLRLGLVCCYLAIRHAIGLGLARFHFLWGHYDYKRRLGGSARPLYRVLVPRSRAHLFRHPVHASRWLAESARDTLRRWRRPAVSRERSC